MLEYVLNLRYNDEHHCRLNLLYIYSSYSECNISIYYFYVEVIISIIHYRRHEYANRY